jgi:hypothetical protein
VKSPAISDLHFGACTGEPLLRHGFALQALEPHVDDIDELILLGDVFDLLFSKSSTPSRRPSLSSRSCRTSCKANGSSSSQASTTTTSWSVTCGRPWS